MRNFYFLLIVIFFVQNLISQNENFEQASLTNPISPSTITVVSTGAVNGWVVNGGSNSTWGASGNCTNTTAITGNPNACVLISPGVSGHIDPIIGPVYPIYSVFGPTTTTYPAATTANGFQCYGDWFIKLNNQTPGSSVNRISKIIFVTTANALFQFAFMNVIQGSHCCCDNGGYTLKLKVGCSVPTLTSCPQYTSTSPAGSVCTPSGSCNSAGNSTSYSVSTINTTWSYSKWKVGTLDLSSFIGNCVTIEITSFDCPYAGHAGYTFFDAQSSPLEIIVNGNTYQAGTPMMTVSHCGAGATATITAPLTAGGYTWTAPGSFTVAPGSGGQTIYTGTPGNHTLFMNPPGSCSPIVRIINLLSTPAPNLVVPTNTMYTCSNATLNGVSLIMSSGTATNNPSIPNYTVTFSPAQPTNTIGVSANTGTYTGLVVGINTITITDSIGCKATQTINVTPQLAIPTFSINAPSGTVVGCVPPTVPLNAINTSTISGMTYTWTSSTQPTSVTANYNGYGNTTYTVLASAPGSCVSSMLFSITQSTAVPSVTVSPISRTLTCNGSCQSFTATSTTTTNLKGQWYDQFGNAVGPVSATPLIICANAPGTYWATYTNVINGCTTTQSVFVSSNTAIPTISVTSVFGFVLSCTRPCLPMSINSSGTLAPTTYTWTNLTTSVSTMPFNGGYTICIAGANTAGSYEAAFMDGNFCKVTTTINVTIDTLRPSPLSMTNLPSNSYTLTCATPSLVATALTNPLYTSSNYSWTIPGPFVINSNTINVGTGNIPGPTGSFITYTVSAMGPNGCVGKAPVRFYKDTYVPPYGIAFTPTAITCANPCVAMTATTTSTVAVTFTLSSPPPTQTATTAGALMCSAGFYTLNYQNVNNGCIGVANTIVPLNVTPPATFALTQAIIPCGSTSVGINAGHTGSNAAVGTYSYSWDGPVGAGMSCPGGISCYSTSVNAPGIYNVYILNLINGCSTTNSVSVIQTPSLPMSISANTLMCVGEIAILTASGASSYTWSTGSNANPIGVNPTVTTTYSVTGAITGSTSCTGQTSFTLTVDPCVGIEELEWSKNISIAPNPNTGKFSVTINTNIENAEIRIINTIGQEVFKQTVKQGINEINVGILAKGIYHYIITQNKQPVNRGKILIE